MNAHITLETTLHTDDRDGREVLTFRPILRAGSLGSGEISLPIWQAYLDEPETHATQRENALRSAIDSYRSAGNPQLVA